MYPTENEVLIKQNKKHLSRRKKVVLGSWEMVEDTQIGQLLYYAVAAQFRHLMHSPLHAPHPVLGLFLEDGMVCFGFGVSGM